MTKNVGGKVEQLRVGLDRLARFQSFRPPRSAYLKR